MSIKVFGILGLSNINLSLVEERVREKVQISFLVIECAIKNKIGINLGGNIASCFKGRVKDLTEKIPFELTDDPMDINAECLFKGDGVTVHVGGVRVDTGETLSDRMSRIQSFLGGLLKNIHVNKIVLDINIEDGDEFETIEMKVNNFCSKMLELYKQEEGWTPTIRIVINK